MRWVASVLAISLMFLVTACNPILLSILSPAEVTSGEVFDVTITYNTTIPVVGTSAGAAVQLPIGFEVVAISNQPSFFGDASLNAQFVPEPGYFVTTIYVANNTVPSAMIKAAGPGGSIDIKIILFDLAGTGPLATQLAANISSPLGVNDFSLVGGAHQSSIAVLPQGTVSEDSWTSEAIPTNFTLLEIVDLDLDGRDELLGVNSERKLVSAAKNSAGNWSVSIVSAAPPTTSAGFIDGLTADFNGNGYPDVFAFGFNGGLQFYPSLANGTFGASVLVDPPAGFLYGIQKATAFDRDDDGDLDLFLDALIGFKYFENDGLGNFTLDNSGLSYLGAIRGTFPYVLDLDGDGTTELAYVDSAQSTLEAHSALVSGGFAHTASFGLSGAQVHGFEDLNQDGLPEMICTRSLASGKQIEVYENTSAAGVLSFSTPMVISQWEGAAIASLEGLRCLDFNSDGFPDLVVPGEAAWRGASNLGFVSVADWHQGLKLFDGNPNVVPSLTGMADLRGDGRKVLIAGRLHGLLQRAMHFARPNLGSCATGNIGAAAGAAEDCLFVNGSSGDVDRRVDVALNAPITIDVITPSANGIPSAHFALWGKMGIAEVSDQLPSPHGTFCVPVSPFTTGSEYFLLADSGNPTAGLVYGLPSPWTYSLPLGLSLPTDLVLTGVIEDDSAPTRFAVMNTVQVSVR